MAEKAKPKVGSHWKRPPTRVYDYNYNVGEHYYKPMMKHLDKKSAGLSTEPPGPKTFAERLIDDPLCCGCRARPDHACEHGHAPRGSVPSGPSSSSPSLGSGHDFPSRPRLSDTLDDPLDDGLGGLGRGGRNRPSRLAFPSVTDEILSSAGLKTPDGFFDDALNDLKKRRPRTTDAHDLLNDPFFAKGRLEALDSKLDKLVPSGSDQSLISASARLASESSSSLNIRKRSVKTTVTSETVRY